MMNIKWLAVIGLTAFIGLTACSKQESQTVAASAEQTATASTEVTPEQQAAIDSLDKPNPEAIQVEENASAEQPASAASAETAH